MFFVCLCVCVVVVFRHDINNQTIIAYFRIVRGENVMHVNWKSEMQIDIFIEYYIRLTYSR